jgi:2-hydroxycyclohexanecarboxyl-CoA dehydrogenase
MRLEGKVAIVTGGGSGIGAEIVRVFAEEGASVAIWDASRGAAENIAAEVSTGRYKATPVELDITDYERVLECVEALERTTNGIDVLVNCAGYSKFGPVEALEIPQWHRTLEVNLTGTFYCCAAVMPGMMKRRTGKIVNVASLAGITGIPDQCAYVAAKHGVVGLTKALATDLGRYQINVNCICPATTLTPMAVETRSAEFLEKEPLHHPLGRLASPRDQAMAVTFLASEEADYLTGVILPVDGGRSVALRTRETAV